MSSRHLRACLGGLWLIAAALQAQRQFFGSGWWRDQLVQSVMGQPEPISRSIIWVTGHLASQAALANSLAVIVQVAVGLGLVLGRHERLAIAASILWSLGVWWIGEGFGALPTGYALLAGGSPGAVLLYAVIGLICWPIAGSPDGDVGRCPRAGTARGTWFALFAGSAVAGLPWRFPVAFVLRANIEEGGLDQPRWLSDISHASYRVVGAHPLLVPYGLLLLQLGVGVTVLGRRTRPYALAAGSALAWLYWIAVQALGGLATGDATDLGSAPLVVLLALAAASSPARPMTSEPVADPTKAVRRAGRRVPVGPPR